MIRSLPYGLRRVADTDEEKQSHAPAGASRCYFLAGGRHQILSHACSPAPHGTMTARKLFSAAALLGLLGCLGLPPRPASVQLFDAQNKLVGFVDLHKIKDGVRLRVHTLGLPGGTRGLNIHTTPVCEPPEFTSAGPVSSAPSGRRDTMLAGDLPDITAGATEWADTTIDWPLARLDGGSQGLFRNGGSSLVITEQPDRGAATPGSSRRLACGPIKERPEER